MNSFTDAVVAIIAVAGVSMLITKPGVATTIKSMAMYLSHAITALLGG